MVTTWRRDTCVHDAWTGPMGFASAKMDAADDTWRNSIDSGLRDCICALR